MNRQDVIVLKLPLPPSVNHAYGKGGKNFYLKKEAIAYRQAVRLAWLKAGKPVIGDRLCKVTVQVQFPDKKRRDTGNLDKVLFDSFNPPKMSRGGKPEKHPGVGLWDDDYQAVDTRWLRKKVGKPAFVIVTIEAFPEGYEPPEIMDF